MKPVNFRSKAGLLRRKPVRDLWLTQTPRFLITLGNAHYHFTVKGNQKALEENIALLFEKRAAPHHEDVCPPDHGRIETRRIWCSTALNDYLDFPHVGQVFLIERDVVNKKSGVRTVEHALGITSQTPQQADPKQVLATNRGHWAIENSCHYVIDWNFNDRIALALARGTARKT